MNENKEPGYSTKNLSKSHPFKFDFHFYLSNSSPWLLRNELNSFDFNPHKATHACCSTTVCMYIVYVYMMLTMTRNFVLKIEGSSPFGFSFPSPLFISDNNNFLLTLLFLWWLLWWLSSMVERSRILYPFSSRYEEHRMQGFSSVTNYIQSHDLKDNRVFETKAESFRK